MRKASILVFKSVTNLNFLIMKKVYNYFALFLMLFAFANVGAQNTFFQEL